MWVEFDHVLQKSCLENIIWLGGLVNKIYNILEEFRVISCSLLVKLLHLFSYLLFFLLEVRYFRLSLPKDLINLLSALLLRLVYLVGLVLKCFFNWSRCINHPLNCALHKSSNTTNRFGYYAKQPAAKTFNHTTSSILHPSLDRLSKNPGHALKCAFEDCIPAIP